MTFEEVKELISLIFALLLMIGLIITYIFWLRKEIKQQKQWKKSYLDSIKSISIDLNWIASQSEIGSHQDEYYQYFEMRDYHG